MSEKRPIHALVNNAGVTFNALFQMTTVQALRDQFEVNFFALFNFTQPVSKLMTRQRFGSIINIASTAAQDGNAGKAAYGASKAAVVALTHCIATELGEQGIRANCIAPGITDTDMLATMPVHIVEETRNQTDLRRLGLPAEIAAAAVWLASDLFLRHRTDDSRRRWITMKTSIEQLQRDANSIRCAIINVACDVDGVHLGSALSMTEIAVALYGVVMRYNPQDMASYQRDRFLLSKGHAALCLYTTLHHYGVLCDEQLATFDCNGSLFPALTPMHPHLGIDFAGGSLGHGVGYASGMALAQRLRGESWKHFIVLGDGECNEGSVWESAFCGPAKTG
jgi:NAD(P)-dependent dehydrogenase (short-subunit alcohol dehydrogenase family)